jgi:AcrR family transcriptional regulator
MPYSRGVPWDTDATRARRLEAGARQFAAHGLAGARMDAIGRDAGVNKERVYHYFGDKHGLFDAVLADEVGALLEGLEPTAQTAAAVGRLAGTMFDRCAARPELPRLLAWESLELAHPVAADVRRPQCATRVSALRRAVAGTRTTTAEHLLLSTIALVTASWTLARVADLVLTDPDDLARRRRMVVAQATALARRAPA